MAVKSVIDIDLDDSKFQRFADLFKRYDEAVKKQPEIWKKIGGLHQKHAENFQEIVSAMNRAAELNREAVESSSAQASLLTRSEGLWSSIARSSGSVAASVARTGAGLLKWTGALGLIGGLLGAGLGVFGFDRLLGGASRDRRASAGLGMSFGGMRAFDTNFQRLIDPAAFTSFINSMELDITQQRPAFALMGHALSGDTGRDALEMLKAARQFAQQGPLNQVGLRAQKFGLPFEADELRRLREMKEPEFQQLMKDFGKDSKTMNVQDRLLKQWQDLSTQLERAGNQISKVFITGLAPLIKPLENLSASFVSAVADFLKSPLVGHSIEALAGWLKDLGSHMGEFDQTIQKWLQDLDDLFDTFHTLTHPGEAIGNFTSRAWEGLKNILGLPGAKMGDMGSPGAARQLSRMDSHFGLPSGLLESVIALESHGDPTAVSKRVGGGRALGLGQLTQSVWEMYSKRLGFTHPDIFDPQQNAYVTAAYLGDLYHQFGGDIGKTLAAYHSGPDYVKNHPGNYTNAPGFPETKQYLLNANPVLSAYGITITVQNRDPGSIGVAANSGVGSR